MTQRGAMVLPSGPAYAGLRQHSDFSPPGPPGMQPKPAKTHEPGADTVRRILHPDFPPLERLFRVLPDQGWFSPSVTPSSPAQFEIGAFTVPKNMHLWLFDYEFSVFRQSGLDPFDAIKAEDERFSGVMGFDIQFGLNQRKGDLRYQIDPIAVPVQRASFGGVAAVTVAFDSNASQSASGFSAAGNSLLPVRSNVQGPRNGVFTFVVEQNQSISLSCIIFRRLMNPVSWIQATMSGYLVNHQVSAEIIDRIRPM